VLHIWSGIVSPWKMLPPVRPMRASMSGGPSTSWCSRQSSKLERYGLSRRPVANSQTLQPTDSDAITAVTPSDSPIGMSLLPRKP
jgi:hypothetical protein